MQSDSLVKVGLVTNIPTPYRLPLFQMLSAEPGLDFEVAFNASSEQNRHWQLSKQFPFKHSFLPGRTISVSGDDLLSYHIKWGIGTWLKRERFDVVIVGGWASIAQWRTIALCRRHHIPVILWSGSTFGERSLLRRLTLPLVRTLVQSCDAYVAYGTAARLYLENLGAPSHQIFLAPNTVDVEQWAIDAMNADSSAKRRELDLHDRVVFLYVGQLIVRKGVDILLQSFAELQRRYPRTALVLAGTGPLLSTLRKQAKDLGLEAVHFVGSVPYQELPAYYAAADAVVLPSRSEVWGLTLNEAMASARPVIASEATGASVDLVKHGHTGWIAATADAASLTQCLVQVACLNKEQRRAVGTAGQQVVLSQFTVRHSADGFLRAIRCTLPNGV